MYDFQSRIKLADQDILNILFHYYPEKLYELPCEWNYRVWLCSEVQYLLFLINFWN
jgi:UDP-xylose:glucoside alpha-1,3-xylosyltransferase